MANQLCLQTKFSLDADILNHIPFKKDPIINEVVELIEKYDLRYAFIIPYTVGQQLNHATTPQAVKELVNEFIMTMPVALTSQEKEQLSRLLDNATGNAKSENIHPDLQHVAEAAKYGNYFITLDKRLWGRNAKVSAIFPNFSILKPTEALETLQAAIKKFIIL